MSLISCNMQLGVLDQQIIYFDGEKQEISTAKTYEVINEIVNIAHKHDVNNIKITGPKIFIEPVISELEEKGFKVNK